MNSRAQVLLPEQRYQDELEFLRSVDDGPRPPGWAMTPARAVDFICGAQGLRNGRKRMDISTKFVGDRALVERCVVTLAGSRALMLVGEPGTAKSMLSELLAAAICGSSALTVQGSAGTTEDQLRYGWNYGLLLTHGPSRESLVPSPVMQAMESGRIARVEEITRCLPEVQDAIVPVLSERRISVPELGEYSVAAVEGFGLIGTANLRDKGVSEMSAALKRRFNFELVEPIADRDAEVSLVMSKTATALAQADVIADVDEVVVHTLVDIFRDLRMGRTREGWAVEKPGSVLSTAEAVAISSSIALAGAYFPVASPTALIPEHLLGAVRKDDDRDADRLRAYWDGVVHRRSQADHNSAWTVLWEQRSQL
ncbi:ATPase AAA [[Brevibacterium] flavum]|uniref:ATPase AAA n=1 Tax=[Brevibacterium] flavum TaxID=92706 RepID=A0A0F6Z7J0_9CORY|nr:MULTISPECIES: AAA family ATPase [Corynebacterium]AKF28452.1 ATPase AAA [[Brevibacterium] flavum]AST21697.1 AAA family ATPase [Corynebacterium glutamicum ATCC 14067]KEI24230.1 ATPase AAA [Corynebacterium glutamicum ATCC 14067]OKX92294.1 AAA family ATPase [Corynebacterium glutamicum]QJS16838.1 AAA family ATPase [Corynebacterium glutamicum]